MEVGEESGGKGPPLGELAAEPQKSPCPVAEATVPASEPTKHSYAHLSKSMAHLGTLQQGTPSSGQKHKSEKCSSGTWLGIKDILDELPPSKHGKGSSGKQDEERLTEKRSPVISCSLSSAECESKECIRPQYVDRRSQQRSKMKELARA